MFAHIHFITLQSEMLRNTKTKLFPWYLLLSIKLWNIFQISNNSFFKMSNNSFLKISQQHLTAPSQPPPTPSVPTQPNFPFSHVVADFFTVDAGTYLAMSDRYSNWSSIFKLKKNDTYHILKVIQQYFTRWGMAVNIITNGASVFQCLKNGV